MEEFDLYLSLFITFFKIGLFGFGGGYAMLSLIQHDVVEVHQWISVSDFTDIVAISQTTPGPIAFNTGNLHRLHGHQQHMGLYHMYHCRQSSLPDNHDYHLQILFCLPGKSLRGYGHEWLESYRHRANRGCSTAFNQ